MTDIRRVAILCAVLTAGLGVSPAQAQTGPLARGVFQGGQEDEESRQLLQLTASFSEGYDDNILSEGVSLVPEAQPVSGSFYSRGDLGLSYGRRTARGSFSADGGVGAVYYPDIGDVTYVSYWGGLDGVREIRRTRLSGFLSASRLPYFLFGGFPAFRDNETLRVNDPGLTTFNQDLAVTSAPSVIYSGGGRVTQPLSRRSTLDGTYDFRVSDYGDVVGYIDQREQGGAARLSFQVSRRTSLRGGYSYRVATYDRSPLTQVLGETSYQTHEIEAGVEYTRALSKTRRLLLSADIGTSINDRDALVQLGTQDHYYRGVGSASLTYDVSRAWTARVEARRSLEYLQGFLRPYFANGISASLGGLLTPRLELIVTGRYSRSPMAFEQIETGYDSGVGSARLQYGLSRNVAIDGEYVYYQYGFAEDAIMPPGFVRDLKRQTVRVGVTFGLPLYRERPRP